MERVIENSINELFMNVNLLLAQFSNVSWSVKYKLFKSYCMSVYGSQLWDYENGNCEHFFTAWRKCIRRIFDLPYCTHSRLLHLICNDFNIDSQLHFRFLNFVTACKNSNNKCVRMCCRIALNGSNSRMSNSLSFICNKYKISRYDFNVNNLKLMLSNAVYNDDLQKAGLIRDLMDMSIDNNIYGDGDIKFIIDDICVN